jgi:Ras-related protein Rab-1A
MKLNSIFLIFLGLFVPQWDTAGQDRFRTVNPAFYRGANGIVLVYDVTNKESFDRIEGWMQEAVQYAQEPRTLLVGNKADLEPRQVTEAMGQELSAKLGGIPFLETSAKNSTNVEAAFLTLAADLVKSGGGQKPKATSNAIPVDPSAPSEKKDGDCC